MGEFEAKEISLGGILKSLDVILLNEAKVIGTMRLVPCFTGFMKKKLWISGLLYILTCTDEPYIILSVALVINDDCVSVSIVEA